MHERLEREKKFNALHCAAMGSGIGTQRQSKTKSQKQNAPRPDRSEGGLGCRSLTMTYFHTGTRTIIGAKSFHCPVRDGKEWDQLAMVIRHKGLLSWG